METGFGRNLLAELLDSVGRGVLLMALGIGWFVFLWGLNLPALLAGIALGTLLLLLRRLYRQTTLARRETALRCRIGVRGGIAVVDIGADIGKEPGAKFIGVPVEDDQIDHHIVLQQKTADGVHRHAQGLILWIPVDAG